MAVEYSMVRKIPGLANRGSAAMFRRFVLGRGCLRGLSTLDCVHEAPCHPPP